MLADADPGSGSALQRLRIPITGALKQEKDDNFLEKKDKFIRIRHP